MSNIKKFGWVNSGVFTLTGNDYGGFYNIKDNVAYAGLYEQKIQLTNLPKIYTTLICSDLFFNRLPTKNFSLTYTLSDFIFEPGEFINSNTIDNKLEKLYINYLDTYRSCFMASSDLPFIQTEVAVVTATNVGNVLTIVGSTELQPGGSYYAYIPPLSTLYPEITRDSKITYIGNVNSDNSTFIIATSGSLIVYTIPSDSTTFSPVFSSHYTETNTADYGSLTFGNITSTSKYGTNYCVCDNGNKSIYHYDIISVLQEDRALGYKFTLVDSINNIQGGFENPVLVCNSNNTIYVYDNYLNTIFFYDYNFNLKCSYKNTLLFASSVPVSLTYYNVYDQLYVLTQDFQLIVLDSNASVVSITQLNYNTIPVIEKARKLMFSSINSDLMYVLSDRGLYRKFVSNVVDNIGSYSFTQNITSYSFNYIGYISGILPFDATTNTNASTNPLLYDIDIINPPRFSKYDDFIVYGYDQLLFYYESLVFNTIFK